MNSSKYNREYYQKRMQDPEFRAYRKQKSMEYAQKHPEKKAMYVLKSQVKKFGLTAEDFWAMLERQNGKCAICNGDPNGQGRLHIDHDHETNRVRGLLCSRCNT